MNKKIFWRRMISIFCVIIFCLTGTSPVSAVEEGADTSAEAQTDASAGEVTGEEPEEEEEERPEPDAYFEPIQSNAVSGWPQGPAVWAESAVVMDLDSGAFLYSKNMDAVKYPASITKILTTLLAIENSRLDEWVTFSEHAIYGIERDSSHIGIRVNEVLSMKECLYGIMLESANEVCLAVAEHICGSVDEFVEMMNQKAAKLGCTNTHFTNPNGLPDENHYTTAHDMALIAQAAYKNPTFRQICQTQISRIPKTNVCGEERWLNNHHKMLPNRAYTYDGCTGGKTGFTQAALNTLVTYAERDGKRLVCVSLRTNGAQVYLDTASLLDYGFQNFQNITLYSRDDNAAAHMLYPSLYFGQPCTIDALRLTSTATIPLSASPDELKTKTSAGNGTIIRASLYHDYPVGQESIPDAAIRTLLTPVTVSPTPENPIQDIAVKPDPSPANTKLSALCQLIDIAGQIPVYIYLLILLLLLLIIMEIVLEVRRSKRRRLRKKKNRAGKNAKKKK